MKKRIYAILGAFFVFVSLGHITAREAKSQGLTEYVPPWGRQLAPEDRFAAVFGGDAAWDLETDLIWQRAPGASSVNWHAAHVFCDKLTLGNRMGWRLPRIQELTSLVDTTQSNPALPAGHPFLKVLQVPYWSATSVERNPERGIAMYFYDLGPTSPARPIRFDKWDTSNVYAWCVRSSIPGTDAQ